MKKLLIGLMALGSVSSFAVDVTGEALLAYTPHLSSTGDLYVYDELADAMFDQLKVKVIKGDQFDAKYGNGIACFKFVNSQNKCRLTVRFTNN